MEPEGEGVSYTLAEFRRLVTEQLGVADAQRDEGNALFKGGDTDGAENKYHNVLTALDALKRVDALKRRDFVDQLKKVEMARLLCYLNLCACSLQCGRLDEAVEHAEAVLAIEPKHVKGLFRLATALQRQGKLDDAVEALEAAEELDPENKDVCAMLKRTRVERRKASNNEKRAFGGLFSTARYKGEVSAQDEELAARARREREAIGGLVRPHVDSASEGALLDRWVSSGAAVLEKEERKELTSFIRRMTKQGRLTSEEHRVMVTDNGLGAAYFKDEEDMENEELKKYRNEKRMEEVNRIVRKANRLEPLEPWEREMVDKYEEEQIDKLQKKMRSPEGLNQEERAYLRQLKNNQEQKGVLDVETKKTEAELEAVVEKLKNNDRLGPFQRHQLYKTLKEQEDKLQRIDDEEGLSHTQLMTLRRLRKMREDRQQGNRNRKAQGDLMELAMEDPGVAEEQHNMMDPNLMGQNTMPRWDTAIRMSALGGRVFNR